MQIFPQAVSNLIAIYSALISQFLVELNKRSVVSTECPLINGVVENLFYTMVLVLHNQLHLLYSPVLYSTNLQREISK